MSIQSNSTKILHFLNSKGTGSYCSGQEIKSKTGLSPDDINDAIEILESYGHVELIKVMGTAPYRFGEAAITAHGRLELEQREQSQKEVTNDMSYISKIFMWTKDNTGTIVATAIATVIGGLLLSLFLGEKHISIPSEPLHQDTSTTFHSAPDSNKKSSATATPQKPVDQQRANLNEPDTSANNITSSNIPKENSNDSQEQPTLSWKEINTIIERNKEENIADSRGYPTNGIVAEESASDDITTKYSIENQEYPAREKQSNNFNFRVSNCELSGNLLTIEMFITNIGAEKRLNINRKTHFISNDGYTYNVKRIRIGGQVKSTVFFPQDVPLKVVLEFINIDTDLSGIKVFRLICYTNDHFPVDFHDLYMQ